MNMRIWSQFAGTAGLAILVTTASFAADPPPPDPTPKGVEVQARGPVHEAFAQPSDMRPLPSVTVPMAPPAAIDELPPDQKPEGDNIQWLPGYWSWGEESKNFLWVSGFWRVPPPNRQWVPGNWQPIEGGYQWTPGFWATAGLQQVEYLPPPPPVPDAVAATPAPDENSIYAPGCWIYRERKYQWRPGFWVKFQPNWVWIPARYVWTPGGYVFVEGYWDHPLEQRGLLFAPIRVDLVVVGPRWVYTPTYVVQPDFLIGALFVRPNYCHYYFGDFFEAKYRDRGFVAWFDYHLAKNVFDPNFAYYHHVFRADPTWERGLRDLYAGRINGTIERPPHTLVQQNTFMQRITVNKNGNAFVKNVSITNVQNVHALAPIGRINNTRVTMLSSLATKTTVAKIDTHVIKVEGVTQAQRTEIHKAVAPYREAAQVRHVVETKSLSEGHTPVKVTDISRTVKVELPKAPVVHVERTKPIEIKAAPKQPELPKHEERAIPAHEAPKFPTPRKP